MISKFGWTIVFFVISLSVTFTAALIFSAKITTRSKFQQRFIYAAKSEQFQFFHPSSSRSMHSQKQSSCRVIKTRLYQKSSGDDFYPNMDAYQVLEIPRSADKKEIKSAYRKAVATWHPDKFPDDEEKKREGGLRMERINRAYFCLGDDDRKRRYDTYGEQVIRAFSLVYFKITVVLSRWTGCWYFSSKWRSN